MLEFNEHLLLSWEYEKKNLFENVGVLTTTEVFTIESNTQQVVVMHNKVHTIS